MIDDGMRLERFILTKILQLIKAALREKYDIHSFKKLYCLSITWLYV